VESGRKPVSRLVRDGEHTACWQYVRVKSNPLAASASRLGVIICLRP
jgi:hypothetical protein